jgi:hypothetical protein
MIEGNQKVNPVETTNDEEISQRQNDHFAMTKCLQDAQAMSCSFGVMFFGQFTLQPLTFVAGQPGRFLWPVSQVEDCDYPKDDCRYSLDYEKPTPTMQSEVVNVEQ